MQDEGRRSDPKAAQSAGSCPDKAMDAALKSAHHYFPKLYRQAKQRRHAHGTPP
ncbi:hypothetical protein [Streptomyces sp. 1222.5]|uniref:hypothetical protein n=1 Tax=Streptomyces sp. 1222.5 TaxID=1881026 RepID=UPI003EBFF128